MAAKDFNFVPKFTKMEFSAQNVAFLDTHIFLQKDFLIVKNLWWAILSPGPCHNATVCSCLANCAAFVIGELVSCSFMVSS